MAVLLIKGNQCANIIWGKGATYVGPLSGLPEAGWKKLPAQMSGDFDHAVMAPISGNFKTLFVKGDQAMLFDWVEGPKTIGTYAQVLAGLGALPAEYQKLRLPAAGRFIGVSSDGGSKVDLRIDLVGEKPVVSGDLFNITDGVESYAISFILKGAAAVTLPATITGTVTYSTDTTGPVQSVTVDKLVPGGTATLTRAKPDGTGSFTYTCAYTSRFLRTIDWEIDYIKDTKLCGQYATTQDTRPDGLDKRIMTVQAAYADAGLELRTAGEANLVDIDEAGTDLMWSPAELHAAMVKNFKLYKAAPQWRLWTFLANHLIENGEPQDHCDGMMFDVDLGVGNYERQGVAIFYDVAAKNVGKRAGLFTYIHEIGHALNLTHSWEKASKDLLGPNDGYGDLSFMNYEYEYKGAPDRGDGAEAFWGAFLWQFTPDELEHLRHGFFLDVAMGGNAFATGSAHLIAPDDLTSPALGRSGLRVQLSGRDTFLYGEPVTVEIKVSLDGSRPQAEAVDDLKPGGDHLSVLVTDPAGDTRPFRPIYHACGRHPSITLQADTRPPPDRLRPHGQGHQRRTPLPHPDR